MTTRMLIVVLIGAVGLMSCAPAPAAPTPDVMVIQTSAAQTVVANFTLTAAAFTPTAPPTTEPPTATVTQEGAPTETVRCCQAGHGNARVMRRSFTRRHH
jgi:hypothetical protein